MGRVLQHTVAPTQEGKFHWLHPCLIEGPPPQLQLRREPTIALIDRTWKTHFMRSLAPRSVEVVDASRQLLLLCCQTFFYLIDHKPSATASAKSPVFDVSWELQEATRAAGLPGCKSINLPTFIAFKSTPLRGPQVTALAVSQPASQRLSNVKSPVTIQSPLGAATVS